MLSFQNPLQEWGEEVEEGAVYGVTLRRVRTEKPSGEFLVIKYFVLFIIPCHIYFVLIIPHTNMIGYSTRLFNRLGHTLAYILPSWIYPAVWYMLSVHFCIFILFPITFFSCPQVSPGSPGYVHYKTCKVRSLRAGTLQKLVENLLVEYQGTDPGYVPTFLSTYRAFTSAEKVLELLLDRCDPPSFSILFFLASLFMMQLSNLLVDVK